MEITFNELNSLLKDMEQSFLSENCHYQSFIHWWIIMKANNGKKDYDDVNN